MTKIIFLDFDGVLNTEHYQGLLMYQGKPWQDRHGAFFDPASVRQLQRIIDATHADIVVESSWKYLGLEAMQEMWEQRHLLSVMNGCLPPIFRILILLWDIAKGWKLHLGLQTMPSLIPDTSSLTMNM